VGLAVTGCSAGGSSSDDSAAPEAGAKKGTANVTQAPPAPVALNANVDGKKDVAVDKTVKVRARHGDVTSVRVTSGKLNVRGELAEDGTWTSSTALEPGRRYDVEMTGTNSEGEKRTERSSFRTDDLTLDEQTYPSMAPLSGSEVGVGMPVIVRFDLPVQRKAAFEKQLSVESEPEVRGTWHWVSDTEVHYRPKKFWEPGTEVTVDADVNSVNAGNGIYGQESRSGTFTVGDSVISHVNLQTNQMRVKINGELARTIPITGGKAGFESRSGTKVIVEKFLEKRMDAATTGIAPGDPEYYNIADVQYAMRVTYTGEFLHAAPWSVDSQGVANVSHGCIGMSTEDAKWLFERSSVGDVVITTGSDRGIEYGNGYTDWDVSYADYREKSALS
jgi:lipoprotein-anchoring transpeptidase ErfK/SrfK